ncbi:MAG: pyrimidine dimer DNA glycosylase/endonuclease V [Lysobacteraceae bacterium]
MRLWTLHPRHLDARGLVALWREGLLARAVLCGQTRGYTRHPQLERFRACARPVEAIDAYLGAVCDEADARGYRFDRGKLGAAPPGLRLAASEGQLDHEWRHLLAKLERRDPVRHAAARDLARPDAHPLFEVSPGPVAPWERP